MVQFYLTGNGLTTIYLQERPESYSDTQKAKSVVDSYSKNKSIEAVVMTMPMTDEDMTMVMPEMGGTTGKYQLSGTATAETEEDVHWFIRTLDSYCSAALTTTVRFYDGIRNWTFDVAVTDVGYEVRAGEKYIIKWKISMTLGTIM